MIHDYFIQQCLDMTTGQSYPNDALGLTVHRYEDDWWVLWHEPKFSDLGREIADPKHLNAFLNGNRAIGKILTAQNT